MDLDSLALKHFDTSYHNGKDNLSSTSRLQLALLKAVCHWPETLPLAVPLCYCHRQLPAH